MELLSSVADLGDVVRAARRARGWSQQRAGDAAGVSRRFVNMIESGRHANAEVGRVLALLAALEIRLGVLAPGDQLVRRAEAPGTCGADDDFDLDAHLATFFEYGRDTMS